MGVQRALTLADKVIRHLEGVIPVWRVDRGDEVSPIASYVVPPGPSDLEPGGGLMVLNFPMGLRFGQHEHPHCTELLIVVNGRMVLDVFRGEDDLPYTSPVLGPGMHYSLRPGERHDVRADCDTTLIAVTVPRDGGFADGCFGIPWPRDAGGVAQGDAGRRAGAGPQDDCVGVGLRAFVRGPEGVSRAA